MAMLTLDDESASDKAKAGRGRDRSFALMAINAAGFTEHDLDLATSGLCGTFALAVKSAFPSVRLALLCLADKDRRPLLASDGDLMWRHAAVLDGETILDVDGRVELADIVANYCWGHPAAEGGVLVEMEPDAFLEILKKDRKSFDIRYLRNWSDALRAARRRSLLEDRMDIEDLCLKPA